jgi:hypothetical protein
VTAWLHSFSLSPTGTKHLAGWEGIELLVVFDIGSIF